MSLFFISISEPHMAKRWKRPRFPKLWEKPWGRAPREFPFTDGMSRISRTRSATRWSTPCGPRSWPRSSPSSTATTRRLSRATFSNSRARLGCPAAMPAPSHRSRCKVLKAARSNWCGPPRSICWNGNCGKRVATASCCGRMRMTGRALAPLWTAGSTLRRAALRRPPRRLPLSSILPPSSSTDPRRCGSHRRAHPSQRRLRAPL